MSKHALLKWLVATATTVALGLATWAAATLVQHEKSIAAGEAERPLIIQRLDRIEDKVDRLLRRNPRRDE